MRLFSTLFVLAVGCFRQDSANADSIGSNDSIPTHRRLAFDPSIRNEMQPQYLEWQEGLTNGTLVKEWEWVLIRIQGVTGLENADWIGQADPVISVEAQGDNLVEPPGVGFYKDQLMSQYVFEALTGTDEAKWYEIGMVAYERGTATRVNIILKDLDLAGTEEVLLEQAVDLATTVPESLFDQWVDVELKYSDYAMNVSLWRSVTPIKTQEDQVNMGLTEVLFDLKDGNVASLVYKTDPTFNQAVLYLPGKADSFAHPHVLDMYQSKGYDFYSLDARYCGRTRQFMNDTLYGHWIDDFDIYEEEIDMTMEFMANNKNYSRLVVHVHSTGVLMALNYVMQVQERGGEDPFDAYILNGPFMDWAHVGGMFYEFVLENAGIADSVGMDNPAEGGGISTWHTRFWLLYRYNVTERPIIQTHVNSEWAQAATNVQRKIAATESPITQSPVLLIASLGDDVVLASESQDRMHFVSSNVSTVILTNNAHDVTYSRTEKLDKDALNEISAWLGTGATTGTFANTTSPASIVSPLLTSLLAVCLANCLVHSGLF